MSRREHYVASLQYAVLCTTCIFRLTAVDKECQNDQKPCERARRKVANKLSKKSSTFKTTQGFYVRQRVRITEAITKLTALRRVE